MNTRRDDQVSKISLWLSSKVHLDAGWNEHDVIKDKVGPNGCIKVLPCSALPPAPPEAACDVSCVGRGDEEPGSRGDPGGLGDPEGGFAADPEFPPPPAAAFSDANFIAFDSR